MRLILIFRKSNGASWAIHTVDAFLLIGDTARTLVYENLERSSRNRRWKLGRIPINVLGRVPQGYGGDYRIEVRTAVRSGINVERDVSAVIPCDFPGRATSCQAAEVVPVDAGWLVDARARPIGVATGRFDSSGYRESRTRIRRANADIPSAVIYPSGHWRPDVHTDSL